MTRLLVAAAVAALTVPAAAADLPAPLNTRAPDFTLPHVATGKPWASAELPRDTTAVVVAFLATGCPVNTAYLPKLIELEKRFRADHVAFVGVNCHPADTAADAARQAADYKLPFPIVKDTDGKLAARLNVDRVPTVLVLDAGRMVRYMGRIDDQFAPGIHRPAAKTRELQSAIAAIVDGREVTAPFVPAAGCLLTRDEAPPTASTVTYHKNVAKIIQAKCQDCHRPGEAAPFVLGTFRQAKSWAAMIREVVADNVMPPWHADAPLGHFANDRRLSPADKATLLSWIDAGCPEGDPTDAPAPRAFVTGWRIGREPDRIIKMAKTINVPAQYLYGAIGMPYQYTKGDGTFAEDTWVQAVEVRPDYRAALHHVIVYVIPPGTTLRQLAENDGFAQHMLASFVPGDGPVVFPAGLAKKIPKGSVLLFENHYTPNGRAGTDQSCVGLVLAKGPPAHEVKSDTSINHHFAIPPGEPNHSVAGSALTFAKPATVIALTPHMHVRGKAFRFDLVTPDGKREVLLRVPKWDFNWQASYVPATPIRVPAGGRIECVAWYDNSAANPSNPDPTKRIRWGQQTWEEMMLGFVEYYE